MAPTMAPLNDWRVPLPYEVKQLIGSGAYGSVCEAYDNQSQRLVAIKRVGKLFEHLIDSKRVLREIVIMSKLHHPNIVKIHNVVAPNSMQTCDELYMVMELCDSDLKKLCRTDVTLSLLHVNTLLYNLLVGLKYLHSAGIYHRDLKPANCLVNQDCSLKICDFGLSCAIIEQRPHLDTPQGSVPRLKRSLTGHVVTRWYRAPELILLQGTYTEAIDVWSAGCIHAELLGMLEGKRVQDRGPLFPGSSCFPLSPNRVIAKAKANYEKFHGMLAGTSTSDQVLKSSAGLNGWASASLLQTEREDKTDYTNNRSDHDQLKMIFDLLGTPSESEIELLERKDAKTYVRSFEKCDGVGVKSKFSNVDSDASLDMLDSMLRFNPVKRIQVGTALEHMLFTEVRDEDNETAAPQPVTLAFENEPNLDEERLRHLFSQEIGRHSSRL